MAIRTIDDSILQGIAEGIQAKDGGGKMYVTEMRGRIDAFPTGGTLIPKTITENGVYNATDDNADGYDVVTVDVLDENTLDKYFANTLEVANIPSATTIGNSFFYGRTNLINVIMPNVTTIDSYAFQDCTKLALTSLPSAVTTIESKAFWGCINLALTSLPSTVTRIGGYAFAHCNKIPYLDFSDFTSIPIIGNMSFYGTEFPLYFRDQQQIDEWAAATNWSMYASRFQIKPSGGI